MLYKRGSIYIILFFIMLVTASCTNVKDKELEGNIQCDEETEFEFKYDSKMAMMETEDGWVHHFICEFDRKNGKPLMYYYDAYNLKYKQLEGYTMEIVDQNGNVCDSIYPSAPSLLMKDDYYDDFMSLDVFFNSKAILSSLNETDAEELVLEYLDKDMIVSLFNTAIESDKMNDGKYAYMPEANIIQEEIESGYFWQVGYFVVHGVIVNINIEIIYEDGTYLTDIVAAGKGDAGELALADMIVAVEDNILSAQNLDIEKNRYEGVDNADYNRLYSLLQKVEEGGYN